MGTRFSDLFQDQAGHLRVVSSCPICNARYHNNELRILEERSDAQLIYLQCRKCQSSVLAVILMSQLGVSSVGLVTDLTGEDVLKFRRQPVLSNDDVLDVHVAFAQSDVWKRFEESVH